MNPSGLKPNAIGLWHIVFFVVAAASPLASLLGSVPPALSLGNGIGTPSVYVIAGLILILFSVGYATMSRYIRSAGAFFAFVAQGLGATAGCGAATLVLLAYHAVQCALYCLFGLFLSQTVQRLGGPSLSWGLYALAVLLITWWCGRRQIEFSGRLLGSLMLCEVAILFALCLAILLQRAPGELSFATFSPSAVIAPGLGITLSFAISSFMGFEATAIFAEEARDPHHTIPRAAYLSIVLIAAFYTFTTWCVIQAYGTAEVVEAARADPDTFWFVVFDRYLGPAWTRVMNGLLITSIFASILAFHNTITRYFYTLGLCGLLPRRLADVHPVHRSPHVAGAVQTAAAVSITLPFILAGSDPFRTIIPWTNATASCAMLAVQILICAAVITFFRRTRQETNPWTILVAPLLAAALLGVCLYLVSANLAVLSGMQSRVLNFVPAGLAAAFVASLFLGSYLKRRHPDRYRLLEQYVRDVRVHSSDDSNTGLPSAKASQTIAPTVLTAAASRNAEE